MIGALLNPKSFMGTENTRAGMGPALVTGASGRLSHRGGIENSALFAMFMATPQ